MFLRSAGKLFQACGAGYEIRLFPYVVVLIFDRTNVLFFDDRRLRIGVYGCNSSVMYYGAGPFKDLNTSRQSLNVYRMVYDMTDIVRGISSPTRCVY